MPSQLRRSYLDETKWLKSEVYTVGYTVHATRHFMVEEDLQKMKLKEPGAKRTGLEIWIFMAIKCNTKEQMHHLQL